MANRPAKVTEIEVKRTVKGAMAAGIPVGRIEVDHTSGKVTIFPLGAGLDAGSAPTGWEDVR